VPAALSYGWRPRRLEDEARRNGLRSRPRIVATPNGGSTTGYQALNEGTPVLGIASNFDQYLTMQAIERRGAGILVKARSSTAEGIASALRTLFEDSRYRESAFRVAEEFARYPAKQRFRHRLEQALSHAVAQRRG
jgi:UDP:flavonoid glycosyltransferase YjiC (YdhE family)